MSYEPVARTILWLLERKPEIKVHRKYLPDVLALLSSGKIRVIDDSSEPLIVARPQPTCPKHGTYTGMRCPLCQITPARF